MIIRRERTAILVIYDLLSLAQEQCPWRFSVVLRVKGVETADPPVSVEGIREVGHLPLQGRHLPLQLRILTLNLLLFL